MPELLRVFGLVTAKVTDKVAGFPFSSDAFQIIILNRDYNVSNCVNLMVNLILNMQSSAVPQEKKNP